MGKRRGGGAITTKVVKNFFRSQLEFSKNVRMGSNIQVKT